MPWFGKSKKKESAGTIEDMSDDQQQVLEAFKKHLVENNMITNRYDDYYLLRFCRARKFELDKVIQMFADFLNWRIENRADEAMVIYKCPNMNEVKKIYSFGYHGTDKEGRPFYIDSPCMFDIDELLGMASKEELYQFYVREYEKLIHMRFPACSAAFETKIETSFSLLDIKGFTMGKLKEKSRDFVKLAIKIGQDNYPEIMHKMFIVNAPFLFKGAWAVIKPFIDDKTRQKISIVGSKFHKELFTYVDPANVPEVLGGECKCEGVEGGCYFSDKGPWQEYPGDEFGEAAKMQLYEEEKKNTAEEEAKANPGGYPIPIPPPVPSNNMPVPVPAPNAADPQTSVPIQPPAPVPAPNAADPQTSVPIQPPAPVPAPNAADPQTSVPIQPPAPVPAPNAADPQSSVPIQPPAPIPAPNTADPQASIPNGQVQPPAPVPVPSVSESPVQPQITVPTNPPASSEVQQITNPTIVKQIDPSMIPAPTPAIPCNSEPEGLPGQFSQMNLNNQS